jgi:predicted esterase
MSEHFIHVQRTARYHMLGSPADAKEIWVVVHGYGQLARFFLNRFEGMEDGRCIVAPEGLNRFYLDAEHNRVGATWMTREDRMHEIEDHVGYLDALTEHILTNAKPGTPVNALGFSQGVATVARWALRGSTPLARMVCWAGGLPAELDQAALQKWRELPIDLVLGDLDEFAKPGDLEAMALKLHGAGVPHRTHRFAGKHVLEPVLLERLITNR